MRKLIVALILLPTLALGDTVVAALGGAKNSEWLVTTTATTLTNFQGRRAIQLQNLGPNSIFCTFDGQTPLATGALGIRIDPGTAPAFSAADSVTIKCVAASANQVTTAATQVLELR